MVDRTCAVFNKMVVGFNYPHPWNVFGIYLGSGNPPGASPGMDAWTTNLKTNLGQLRALGIQVVRIFLLGNAANYGTVAPGPVVKDVTTTGTTTLPASLHPKVTTQLREMFQAFKDTDMLVIPSLIDFKAFGRRVVLKPGPPVITNGCTNRHDLANDDAKRAAFFEQVLKPFLTVSAPFRSAIYAWEVQNEPIWNTSSLAGFAAATKLATAGGPTITGSTMKTFLQEAVNIIESFSVEPKFRATVGHRFSDDLDGFPTGKARQFHYYPLSETVDIPFLGKKEVFLRDEEFPPFTDTNAFVGEIDTGGTHGRPWPELKGADTGGTRQRVLERLKLVQKKGYALCLLWPDLDGGSFPGPDPIKLSADAQQGVQDFMALPRPTTSP